MAGSNELIIYRGDSYPITAIIRVGQITGLWNSEIPEPVPVNLAGATVIMTVSYNVSPDDDSCKLFSINGVIDPDPASGKVVFTPTSENTNLPAKTYYYDIQYIDANGNIRTIIKSKLIIVQDISK